MRRCVLLLGCVLLASPLLAQGPSEELEKLAAVMQQRENALMALIQQEHSITRALGDLDETLDGMESEARRLDAAAKAAEERVGTSELEAARLTRDLETAEDGLRRRLQHALRLGPAADIQVMLGAQSIQDLVWRRRVVRALAAQDASFMEQVRTRRTQLLEERKSLAGKKVEFAAAKARLELARSVTSQARAARQQALMEVATQKGAAQREMEALQAARHRLQGLVDDLPTTATTGFASLKGQMAWPALGEVTIPFGPRKSEAGETMHGGISIAAPLGEPVKAVARGRVVHAGWLRGFGQLLILDHGEGFHTLMAHLSRINVAQGDEVTDGDTVAYVGDSESLEGPALYFELRAKGRAVDPVKWLKKQ